MTTTFADISFCLVKQFQGVIDLDPQLTHGTFQTGMPEQQLHGSRILARW